MQHFSRKFTRDRLLEVVWELSKDPVSNVRLRCAHLMLDVKRILRPPVESEHLMSLQQAVQRLASDSDTEVKAAMLQVQPAIDDLEKKHVKYSQALAKAGSKSGSGVPDEEDLNDRKKEEAEGTLLESAKEADKMERRQKLRELLKSEREAEGKDTCAVPAIALGKRPVGGAVVGKPPAITQSKSNPSMGLPKLAPAPPPHVKSTNALKIGISGIKK
jgi:hypothetical protein